MTEQDALDELRADVGDEPVTVVMRTKHGEIEVSVPRYVDWSYDGLEDIEAKHFRKWAVENLAVDDYAAVHALKPTNRDFLEFIAEFGLTVGTSPGKLSASNGSSASTDEL